ncbi:MAG: beta-galactosidase [Bacteroidota bacterium]
MYRLIIGVLILFSLSFKAGSASAQWKQDKFIIGSYIDPRPDSSDKKLVLYEKKVSQAKAAYFNFFSGKNEATRSRAYDSIYIAMQKILTKYQIKSLYVGRRMSSYTDSTANKLFEFIHSLPENNLVDGYHLRDEPAIKEAAGLKKWIRAIKTRDPNKLAHINLLPSSRTHEYYEAYLDTFLTTKDPLTKLDIVSYDCYPFVKDTLRKDYFYNLYILHKKAEGRPLWYYSLTTPHRNYNDPGMYELSFTAFCPIAYGGKGIMYFTYVTLPHNPEHFGTALIDTLGKPSVKYEYVKKINKYISEIIGPIVMRSKLLGTYHVSHQPYNQWISEEELLGTGKGIIVAIHNKNILAALFKDSTRRNLAYLFLVNKSVEKQTQIPVLLKGHVNGNIKISVPVEQYSRSSRKFVLQAYKYDNVNDETIVYADLEPGEARIISFNNITE